MTISSCSSCNSNQANHEAYMNAIKEAAAARHGQEAVQAAAPQPIPPAQPYSYHLDIKA